ncbi:hypothetical protein GJAV_G00152830 [Gymnothorax javanicus]|nr:hypothetical protein GJAV_G00152830 [Gymnothorax javanicus]
MQQYFFTLTLKRWSYGGDYFNLPDNSRLFQPRIQGSTAREAGLKWPGIDCCFVRANRGVHPTEPTDSSSRTTHSNVLFCVLF